LNSPVTEEDYQMGARILSQELKKIAPSVLEYQSANSPFIQEAIESIRRQYQISTKRDFYQVLAELIVFLSPFVSNMSNQIFEKRVKLKYYTPSILVNLPYGEKLPSIFSDPRIPEDTQTFVTKVLLEEQHRVVDRIGIQLFYRMNLTQRQYHVTIALKKPVVELPVFRDLCKNMEDIRDIPMEDLVHYREEDDIYCFSIQWLVNRFMSDNYMNPYTNREFSNSFITLLTTRYSLPQQQEDPDDPDDLDDDIDDEEEVGEEDLAPGFWDIIWNNIRHLEGDLVDSSNSSPKEKKCEYCKKYITKNTSLRSIMTKNENPEVVRFCSFECFEEQENWPRSSKNRNEDDEDEDDEDEDEDDEDDDEDDENDEDEEV
jgi:hypothetical protein